MDEANEAVEDEGDGDGEEGSGEEEEGPFGPSSGEEDGRAEQLSSDEEGDEEGDAETDAVRARFFLKVKVKSTCTYVYVRFGGLPYHRPAANGEGLLPCPPAVFCLCVSPGLPSPRPRLPPSPPPRRRRVPPPHAPRDRAHGRRAPARSASRCAPASPFPRRPARPPGALFQSPRARARPPRGARAPLARDALALREELASSSARKPAEAALSEPSRSEPAGAGGTKRALHRGGPPG